jgi:hypothetical protein
MPRIVLLLGAAGVEVAVIDIPVEISDLSEDEFKTIGLLGRKTERGFSTTRDLMT